MGSSSPSRKNAIRVAAKRVLLDAPESLKTIETSLGSAMFLREGQPHIREGIPILARHLSTLVFAIAQALLVAVVAHDFWQFTHEASEKALVLSALKASPLALAQTVKGGLLVGLLPAMPLFFLINIGWVLFAEKLLYPERPFWKLYSLRNPRTLLAGLMGLVPLRFVAIFAQGVILPEWVTVASSEPKAAIQGIARLGQFYTAARIAMLNSREEDSREPEIAFAKAIVSRGEEIWDGLGSYVWVPMIVFLVAVALYFLSDYFGVRFLFEMVVSPASILLWIAYVAFTKAGLGALIIDAMREPRA